MANTVAQTQKNSRKTIWIVIAAIVFVVSFLVPAPAGLDPAGKQCVFLVIIALILLLSNCVDIGVAGFLLFALQPIMGVTSNFAGSLGIWSMTSTWFLIASFGLSAVITSTSIPKRILAFLMRICGQKTSRLLLGVMIGTGFISMWMSNIPSAALPMSFILVLINAIDDPDTRRKLARPFMIGIPFASMIGGMGTPAGSTANVIALDLLHEYTGMTVSFVAWIAVGLPLVIVGIPVCWFLLCKIFPPPQIDDSIRNEFVKSSQVKDPFTSKDKRFTVIMLIVIVLWILSSWIKVFDTSMVAILGLCAFALFRVTPIVDILKSVPWNAVIMAMGFGSVAGALNSTGVVTWFADNYLSIPANVNMVLLLILLGVVIAILHIAIPTGPSLVRLLAAPLIAIGGAIGFHPAVMIVPLALNCAICMLVPLDSVPILTYGKGYYTFKDYAKAGIPATIVLIVLFAVWLPIILWPLGLLT